MLVGANVNHIDKGGFSPIDFAVMNRNLELVSFLLEHNADVLHINEIFVVQRKNILSYVSDAATRSVLQVRIDTMSRLLREKKAQKEMEALHAAAMARMLERHRMLQERRKLKIEIRKKAEAERYSNSIRSHRVHQVDSETAEMTRRFASFDTYKYGEWQRHELTGNWTWKADSTIALRHEESVIPASRKLMRRLRDRNKMSIFNDRWENITGQKLEVDWKKWDVFDIDGIDSDDDSKKSVANKKDVDEVSDDLDYRDENDAELEGEDLDEIVQTMKT